MIESIENALQIIVLTVCAAYALYRAAAGRSRAWTLLFFFYGSWLLGDIYWQVYLIFFGDSPQVSVISDLSWYASYLFLYLLLRQTAPPAAGERKHILPYLGYVFTMAMAAWYYSFYIDWSIHYDVHYVMWGKAVDNLIYGILMGLLLYAAIRRVMDARGYQAQRRLCVVILVFCLLEYALWTVSCFWWEETLSNPYYWFDLLLTASFVFFIPATERAVAA